MYGSSLRTATEMPRLLSSRPSEATVMPLPTDETTPPLTKMYLDTFRPPESWHRPIEHKRIGAFRKKAPARWLETVRREIEQRSSRSWRAYSHASSRLTII